MRTRFRKALIFVLAFILIYFLFSSRNAENECEKRINYDNIHVNDGINLDSLFAPPDSSELNQIKSDWAAFDSKSDAFEIVQEIPYAQGRKHLIVEQTAEGRKHYGIILTPINYDESKKYPVILWAPGLNQRDPKVVLKNTILQKFPKDYFGLVPSYRGQALYASDQKYCSDGFFGDAFDGATDDAIRLLQALKDNFNGVDEDRIAVAGGSRGGTVALLMAARDTTVNACVSMAGPVDFHNRDPYDRYANQFKYQFLNERKPMAALRMKMLKSSPIHFIENYANALFIVHGKDDSVVPLLNAERVIEKFKFRPDFDYYLADAGHRVPAIDKVIEWVRMNNQ